MIPEYIKNLAEWNALPGYSTYNQVKLANDNS